MEAHIHKHTQRHALSLTNRALRRQLSHKHKHTSLSSLFLLHLNILQVRSLFFSLLSNLCLCLFLTSQSLIDTFSFFSLFLSFSLLFLSLAHSLILILVVSQGVWYQGPYLSRNISFLIQLLHLLIDQLIVQQISLTLKGTGIIF